MAIVTAAPMEERLAGLATAIRQLIPAAEVRLFSSWARGEAGPDSDVDLVLHSSSEAARRAQADRPFVIPFPAHGTSDCPQDQGAA